MLFERDRAIQLGFYMNILGIVLNLLLFAVVLKLRNNKQIRYYSQIVLCSSFIDLYFSAEQIFTQHRLIIKNGTIFIIPMGAESNWLGTSWLAFSFAWHICGPAHIVCSLPAFFHYRLVIISGDPKFKILAKSMLLSTIATIFTASSAGLGVWQAQGRGMESYARLLNGIGLELRADQFYAIDLSVLGCLGFIVSAMVLSNLSICLIMYFVYRTWKFVNFFSNQVQSGQSKHLQAQFTRYLIAQTFTGVFFAIGPVAFISFCMIFRVDITFSWLLFPLACVPALNVVLTLLMVSTYRRCLLRMLCPTKTWNETSLINQQKLTG